MIKIVILTGSELRHRFMRMALWAADGVNVARSYCESVEGTALNRAYESGSQVQIDHLERRARVEEDFLDRSYISPRMSLIPLRSHAEKSTRSDTTKPPRTWTRIS